MDLDDDDDSDNEQVKAALKEALEARTKMKQM